MVRPVPFPVPWVPVPGYLDSPVPALYAPLHLAVLHKPVPGFGQLAQGLPQSVPLAVLHRQGQEDIHGPIMLSLDPVQHLAQLVGRFLRPPADADGAQPEVAEVRPLQLHVPVLHGPILQIGRTCRRPFCVILPACQLIQSGQLPALHFALPPWELGIPVSFSNNFPLRIRQICDIIHVQ